MRKLKITAGIIWALAGLILIIILFPGLGGFSTAFSKLPFMKINPRFSGGEVAFMTVSPGCTLVVHKPVFNGLISERKTGFIQVDWRGIIPEKLTDTIDFNSDSLPDFGIRVDTRKNRSEIFPLNAQVGNIEISTGTSYGWTIRTGLKKQKV
jgi:hypothetical protein